MEILDKVHGYNGEYVGMLLGDILTRWFEPAAGCHFTPEEEIMKEYRS